MSLQEEVKTLAGERYAHGKENLRWGGQNGSVYLLDQKVPMMVPRVRNKLNQAELGLSYYQKLQQPYRGDEQVFKKLLNGLSTHKYRESAELVPEVFGLSASNLSRRFKYASYAKLRQLQERRLERYDFVAITTFLPTICSNWAIRGNRTLVRLSRVNGYTPPTQL